MPDYSACLNAGCPSHDRCARFRMSFESPSRSQSFSSYTVPANEDRCPDFLDADDAPFEIESAASTEQRARDIVARWGGRDA